MVPRSLGANETKWREDRQNVGIEAVVQDIGLNSVYPNIPGLSGFRILVPESDAARARDLLDEADENGVVDEEEEE